MQKYVWSPVRFVGISLGLPLDLSEELYPQDTPYIEEEAKHQSAMTQGGEGAQKSFTKERHMRRGAEESEDIEESSHIFHISNFKL